MPCSRWGHQLVANENKIVLFGGMNLSTYCESVLYEIHIDDNLVVDYLGKPLQLKDEQKLISAKLGSSEQSEVSGKRSSMPGSDKQAKPEPAKKVKPQEGMLQVILSYKGKRVESSKDSRAQLNSGSRGSSTAQQ